MTIKNYELRSFYLHVLDEFRASGGVTRACPPIPGASVEELLIDDFFRARGSWVEPNPKEGQPLALDPGRTKPACDRVIDGVPTEYKSPTQADPSAVVRTVIQKYAVAAVDQGASALVVDVRGVAGWTNANQLNALSGAKAAAPNLKVRFLRSVNGQAVLQP